MYHPEKIIGKEQKIQRKIHSVAIANRGPRRDTNLVFMEDNLVECRIL